MSSNNNTRTPSIDLHRCINILSYTLIILTSFTFFPQVQAKPFYKKAATKKPCKRSILGFSHSKGKFLRIGTKWTEYNLKGQPFSTFQEVKRTSKWILVKNKSRGMLLRFPLRGKWLQWSKVRPIRWYGLYKVQRKYSACHARCRPKASKRCHKNLVYYYDSCLRRGKRAKKCKHSCYNGKCVTPKVRVLYLIPKGRKFNPKFALAIQKGIKSVQGWYKKQMGKTFRLHSKKVKVCRLPRAAKYYARNSWGKVMKDVQKCAKVMYNSNLYTWVLYADVIHACKAPGRLGAGTKGVTIMPRQDMHGLIGARYFDDCGKEYKFPVTRYIGGAAHEMGHAFGLPHPPGCDAGKKSCDTKALMWGGYVVYPRTYLRQDEKKILRASPFFR